MERASQRAPIRPARRCPPRRTGAPRRHPARGPLVGFQPPDALFEPILDRTELVEQDVGHLQPFSPPAIPQDFGLMARAKFPDPRLLGLQQRLELRHRAPGISRHLRHIAHQLAHGGRRRFDRPRRHVHGARNALCLSAGIPGMHPPPPPPSRRRPCTCSRARIAECRCCWRMSKSVDQHDMQGERAQRGDEQTQQDYPNLLLDPEPIPAHGRTLRHDRSAHPQRTGDEFVSIYATPSGMSSARRRHRLQGWISLCDNTFPCF